MAMGGPAMARHGGQWLAIAGQGRPGMQWSAMAGQKAGLVWPWLKPAMARQSWPGPDRSWSWLAWASHRRPTLDPTWHFQNQVLQNQIFQNQVFKTNFSKPTFLLMCFVFLTHTHQLLQVARQIQHTVPNFTSSTMKRM